MVNLDGLPHCLISNNEEDEQICLERYKLIGSHFDSLCPQFGNVDLGTPSPRSCSDGEASGMLDFSDEMSEGCINPCTRVIVHDMQGTAASPSENLLPMEASKPTITCFEACPVEEQASDQRVELTVSGGTVDVELARQDYSRSI